MPLLENNGNITSRLRGEEDGGPRGSAKQYPPYINLFNPKSKSSFSPFGTSQCSIDLSTPCQPRLSSTPLALPCLDPPQPLLRKRHHDPTTTTWWGSPVSLNCKRASGKIQQPQSPLRRQVQRHPIAPLPDKIFVTCWRRSNVSWTMTIRCSLWRFLLLLLLLLWFLADNSSDPWSIPQHQVVSFLSIYFYFLGTMPAIHSVLLFYRQMKPYRTMDHRYGRHTHTEYVKTSQKHIDLFPLHVNDLVLDFAVGEL